MLTYKERWISQSLQNKKKGKKKEKKPKTINWEKKIEIAIMDRDLAEKT